MKLLKNFVIYIYKAGDTVTWLLGLMVLALLAVANIADIPHLTISVGESTANIEAIGFYLVMFWIAIIGALVKGFFGIKGIAKDIGKKITGTTYTGSDEPQAKS